jgi:hypothetical protein
MPLSTAALIVVRHEWGEAQKVEHHVPTWRLGFESLHLVPPVVCRPEAFLFFSAAEICSSFSSTPLPISDTFSRNAPESCHALSGLPPLHFVSSSGQSDRRSPGAAEGLPDGWAKTLFAVPLGPSDVLARTPYPVPDRR